ncbi:hypothetical protein Tco_1008247 [Tanacetum coccineum]
MGVRIVLEGVQASRLRCWCLRGARALVWRRGMIAWGVAVGLGCAGACIRGVALRRQCSGYAWAAQVGRLGVRAERGRLRNVAGGLVSDVLRRDEGRGGHCWMGVAGVFWAGRSRVADEAGRWCLLHDARLGEGLGVGLAFLRAGWELDDA